ncbi:hypothetical protein H8S37_01880 [Mediterraneibacter sp. NSJ-55]|uniref:Uncharacterized protein n=1 Tax=Mediterraneibacter hominis TaxID=2763054 RepID=A0A923LFF1_9FIRM|nr:DUF6612 family protein [Mediterraneibacter hominis]MBC5687685.1 hypothetical protein [Mediterraneibacter hominis]
MDQIKKKRRVALTGKYVALIGVCLACLTGCSQVTSKKLVDNAAKNMEKEKSFANTVKLDFQVDAVVDSMGVSMEMEMESTASPRAGHAAGTAKVNVKGTEVASEMEIYQVTEGNEHVTYSSIYDEWTKETAGASSQIGVNENFFQSAKEPMEAFHLSKETVEVEGKECYQMYGDIPCKELTDFLGEEMIYAFGLLELPEMDTVENMKIPVIFDVYKEEMLPARMIVDMKEAVENLYDSYGEGKNVSDFTIELIFRDYGKVPQIQVPQEVKEAAE